MKRHHRHRRCPVSGRRLAGSGRAFTLIELLVVIAIISLLMSILMPSLKQGKRLAESTVCMTTIRNLHTGFMMYAQDFDEYVVPARVRVGTTFYGNIWRNLLFAYTDDNRNAYRCPTDDQFCPEEEPYSGAYGWNANAGFNTILSYGYNVWNVGRFREEDDPVSGWCSKYQRLGTIVLPARTFVFADSYGTWNRPDPNWKYQTQIIPKWTHLINAVHIDRANMVFLDGAVNQVESPYASKAAFAAGDVEDLR